jgi:hypothetical protein
VKTGSENDRRRFVELGDMPRRLDAVHARHADIEQHDIGLQALRHAERFQPVDRLADQLVLFQFANHARQAIARRFFIVDYQYLHSASALGMVNVTV